MDSLKWNDDETSKDEGHSERSCLCFSLSSLIHILNAYTRMLLINAWKQLKTRLINYINQLLRATYLRFCYATWCTIMNATLFLVANLCHYHALHSIQLYLYLFNNFTLCYTTVYIGFKVMLKVLSFYYKSLYLLY